MSDALAEVMMTVDEHLHYRPQYSVARRYCIQHGAAYESPTVRVVRVAAMRNGDVIVANSPVPSCVCPGHEDRIQAHAYRVQVLGVGTDVPLTAGQADDAARRALAWPAWRAACGKQVRERTRRRQHSIKRIGPVVKPRPVAGRQLHELGETPARKGE